MSQPIKLATNGAGTVKSNIVAQSIAVVGVLGIAGAVPLDVELWRLASDGTTTSAGAQMIAHVKAPAGQAMPLSFSADGIAVSRAAEAPAGAPAVTPIVAAKFNDADANHELWLWVK